MKWKKDYNKIPHSGDKEETMKMFTDMTGIVGALKIVMVSVYTLFAIVTQAQEVEEPKVEIDGFVRNYTGILLGQGNDFSIVQNTLDLTLKHQKEKVGFVANPFMYQYPYKDNYFGVRELYMDFYSDKTDIRIGKQQIIWGQADGVFITDIVSPKNLTEFLLWDFNEIRMGVTAVKANFYPHPDHDFEAVWIPAFTPTLAPEAGTIWYPEILFPAPPIFDMSNAKVPVTLKNSELFGRYTLSKSAIDLQIIGGYTWDDDPSIHAEKQLDSVTMQLTGIILSPEHHRLALTGASFSTEIQGFVIRGEGAWYKNKYFQTTAPDAVGALTKKDYVNYVIGIDKTIGTWRLSGQFIQKIILDYNDMMRNDEVDNLATLMVNKTLFREQVRLEFFSYLGLNNEDALIRFRGYYFPYDGVSLELGTNIFVGEKGIFGQYNDNDMVYTRIKYSF
ncbi:MAG: hypothetical protein OEX02_14155 [Cyclobacteriaceae bacterium]|nr:hypothetical protein [Cyclobacteriaceae bacterium]